MSLASLAAWCDSKMGLPYSTAYSRFGYSDPEHYDCSGFVWRACNENGFPLQASVSWTIQLEGERYEPAPLTCSRDYAMRRICIAVHGGDTAAGGGPNGHICITDGNGGTWEAMGTRYGCRKGTISNRFEYFMRLPPAAVDTTAEAAHAASLEKIRQAVLNRKKTPMWLIRDSRNGGIYLYNGINARHLDGVEVDQQQAFMARSGIPNEVIDGTNYLIDRLRERGLLVGTY